jgi:predicted nucleotidyltransferase
LYTVDDLVEVLSKIKRANVEFVIIGSTVLQLALRQEELSDDVDVFVIRPSPVAEEEFFREVAGKNGWSMSFTDLGTPRLMAKSSSGREIVVELYENVYDFYVPENVLNSARKIKLRGEALRVISLEDYVVLKARAGRESDLRDLKGIGSLVATGRLRLDRRLVERRLQLFEEDAGVIRRRLESVGLLR